MLWPLYFLNNANWFYRSKSKLDLEISDDLLKNITRMNAGILIFRNWQSLYSPIAILESGQSIQCSQQMKRWL